MSALPRSLAENPLLSQWIAFPAKGVVQLSTGKVELGQGVLTALAQIAAEELEISPARLCVVSGDTAETPAEGYTAGSLSIEIGGGAIRLVCAEVRALFLTGAAQRLNCSPDALTIDDGTVLQNGAPTALDYWSLAPLVDLARAATGGVAPRSPGSFRVVGTSLPRLDLPGKLAGGGFIHDLRPQGMLHARVLHAPRRRARLATLDDAAIRRAAGGQVQILRIGTLAAVVAADETTAVAALEAAHRHATWDGGVALRPGDDDPRLLTRLPTEDRIVEHPGAVRGGDAVGRIEATYTRPYIAHASLAPSCALALWSDDTLTVWSHSQGVAPLRGSIARALRMPPESVRVQHAQGAGCYGHNGADDVAFEAAVIAVQIPGTPVRLQWTRADEMTVSPFGAASVVRLAAATDAEGRPVDWTIEIWSPSHVNRPGANGGINLLAAEDLPGLPPPPADLPDAAGAGGVRNAFALYDLPPQRLLHHFVPHTPLRTSSMRGLGAQANVFAIESFIEELALAAGADPVAYRLSLMSDPRARAVIADAARMSGWENRPPGGEGRGTGFAFSRYKNRAGYLAVAVDITVEEAVRVNRVWAACDAGLVVNPDGARNQIEGGIVQAISWTLKEQVRVDADGIATAAWESYPILRFAEVPDIEISLIGSAHDPSLGLGEVALGPTCAAIANAVAHALGVRLRDLPLNRDKIMAALLA